MERMAAEEEKNKGKLEGPDMQAIKSIMAEKRCTYKEAKDLYYVELDKKKTEQINALNRGNKRFEEERTKVFAKNQPKSEFNISGFNSMDEMQPDARSSFQKYPASRGQYLSAFEQKILEQQRQRDEGKLSTIKIEQPAS